MILGKSWKSTLLGLALGVGTLVAQGIDKRAANPNAPPVTVGSVAASVATVLLGRAMKGDDH